MNVHTKFRSLTIALALVVPMAVMPTQQAHAGVFISVGFAPPVLPVYAQPICPGDGYMWTPGYWAYGDAGYYWVPGVWVQPPMVGVLWTPGYWGWGSGAYLWHAGYWGPHIGFYGGVNYGFGYGGIGYEGGYWNHGAFFYNRAVGNYGGVYLRNGYSHGVPYAVHSNVAFNGGVGGIQMHASAQEMAAGNEHHYEPTANQMQHQNFAAQDRSQYAAFNHGRPGTMAAANVGAYHQVAAQRIQSHPLTAQDRQVGHSYSPNAREANQQQRIANGVRSGQMTSGEAARAENNQARTAQTIHNDRAANGGTMTQQERQQVNRQQNRNSNQIYNEKHNGNTSKPAKGRR